MKKIIALFLCCSGFVFSQTQIDLDGKLKDKLLSTYTGVVVVKTSRYLYGIDSETQSVKWKNRTLSNVNFSNYSEIPYTPYLIFEQKPLLNSKLLTKSVGAKGVSKTIINCNNGNILFDSETQEFRAVLQTMLLPEFEAVLVSGIKKGNHLVIGMYNYNSGLVLWENNLTNSDFFKTLKGALLEDEKIEIDANKNIYWLNNRILLKIDGASGKILNQTEQVKNFVLNDKKNVVYTFSNKLNVEKLNEESTIVAKNTKSDSAIWHNEVKVVGNVSEAIIDGQKLVVITSKGFNIIDAETSEKQWERSDALPLIKKIVPVDSSFLVVQQNFLTKISKEGKKEWKNPIKILQSGEKSSIQVYNTKDEAIYITPSFSNIVSLSSGEKLWNSDVVFNDTDFVSRNLKLEDHQFKIWFDDAKKQFPVYNENAFYLLNVDLEKTPKALYEFNFDREIPRVDIRPSGYFLSHRNEFHFFSHEGEHIYEKKYGVVNEKSLLKDSWYWLNRGYDTYNATTGFVSNQLKSTFKSVLVSQNLGVVGSTLSSIYGSYESYKNSFDDLTKLNALGLGKDINQVINRMTKAQEFNNTIIVVASNGSLGSNSIVELSIETGDDKIIRNVSVDKTNFIIDQVEKRVYFFSKNKVLIENVN